MCDYKSACPAGAVECANYTCSGVRFLPSVLSMTLNCIWWWDSSFGALGNVKFPFIAIAP